MSFATPAPKIAWIQDHLIVNDSAYGEPCFGTNEQPGKDFRGRGPRQLTHYESYRRCAQTIGYSQPELVENNPLVIIETGLWFWNDRGIGSIADNPTAIGGEGVKKVTRPINSGYKNLPERQQFRREISSIFNQDFSSGCTDD
jgi:predicted chitinase